MKKMLMIIILGGGFLVFLNAEEPIETSNDSIALYAGIGTSQLDGQGILSLNTRLALGLSQWLEAGIQVDVIHTLERTYVDDLDRKYQAESGSSGIYLRPHWKVLHNLDLGLSLASGAQAIQLRYSGELRDSMVWTEEIPDQIIVPFTSIALTIEFSLCPVHSLFLETGFRQLHPFQTDYLDHETESAGAYAVLFYGVQL